MAALDQLEKEKNIPKKDILDAVKRALTAAYKGHAKTEDENIFVEIDEKDGSIGVFHRRTVVENVENPDAEVSLEEMQKIDESYELGDIAEFPFPVEDFGRIAAQTAKQVVVQAMREVERNQIYSEYKDRQGELITGVVQRVGGGAVYVTIGRTEGILPFEEQARGEQYTANTRMKFYIVEVRDSQKGPQIVLSRTHPGLVKKLFELEVPEIRDGFVTIESIAREAGSRTKIAVLSSDESVDPVGACVGSRGNRVQAVTDELLGEKIDIVSWTDDLETNIKSALSPAQTEKVVEEEPTEEDEDGKLHCTVIVPDDQLSLAIGKSGQNVRLAARLCGVKIDIKSHTQYYSLSEELVDISDAELDEEGFLNPEDFLDEDEKAEEPVEAEASEDTGLPRESDDSLAMTEGEEPVEAEEETQGES